ncbi:MAG: hypothetical protein ACI9C4_003048 [Paraglaciecola sp.]
MENDPLCQALLTILPHQGDGISEFELLNILQQPPYKLFDKDALGDPLLLFQTHFVLFNALYQLRDHWYQQRLFCLDIVLTHIRLLPYHPGESGLVHSDKLREYYLDWQNFSETDRDDVTALIDNFWRRIQGEFAKDNINSGEIRQAYQTLGLEQDASFALVKRCYRKQLYQDHPDRGGDTAQAQIIEQAYRLLKDHLA